MTGEQLALRTAAQVEELADSLSAMANELHGRLMAALKQRGTAATPDLVITQPHAQALFDDEVALRQHANALYADAASHILDGLAMPQQQLIDLTLAARRSIRQVQLVQDAAAITLDVLAFASAAVAGKADTALKSLQAMKTHLAALHATQQQDPPPKPVS